MDKKTRFIAAKKKFQEEHRRLGLCYDCNNRPDIGKSRCSSCMEKRRLNENTRKAKAVSLGLCRQCCRAVPIASHTLCECCYLRDIALKRLGSSKHWKAIKQRFEDQQRQCALSGVPLTLGKDAELDHINPSARGGINELDNVQWVLCVVNRMKDHMIESEFFGLVEKLYHTMKGKERLTCSYKGGQSPCLI